MAADSKNMDLERMISDFKEKIAEAKPLKSDEGYKLDILEMARRLICHYTNSGFVRYSSAIVKDESLITSRLDIAGLKITEIRYHDSSKHDYFECNSIFEVMAKSDSSPKLVYQGAIRFEKERVKRFTMLYVSGKWETKLQELQSDSLRFSATEEDFEERDNEVSDFRDEQEKSNQAERSEYQSTKF